MVDIDAGHHRVLILLEPALEGYEFELGVHDNGNVGIWQDSDLIAELFVRP